MRVSPALLLAAVLLGGTGLATGPDRDADAELARIGAAYAALDVYAVEVAFALYSDAAAMVPFETAEAAIQRRGALVRSRLAEVETLVAEEILVVADHGSGVLMVGPRPAPADPLPTLQLDPDSFDLSALLGEEPEALIESAASLRVAESGRRLRTLSIDYPRGEHRRVEVAYDPRTYLVERVVLFFREPLVLDEGAAAAPRIEVRYRNLDTHPDFAADTFSPDRFFTRGPRGEIEPRPPYRGYRLIQHLTPPGASLEEPR